MLNCICEVTYMEKYFKVLDTYPIEGLDNVKYVTEHYINRSDRVKNMNYNIKLVNAFVVDKHHENGLEIHAIYDDGTIKIFNYRTKKLITVLFGRVGQIVRYYQELSIPVPYAVLCKADENEKQGRNHL